MVKERVEPVCAVKGRSVDTVEGGRMTKTLWWAVLSLAVVGLSTSAAGLGGISLGFHLLPAVETIDGVRPWDLSLSFGIRFNIAAGSSIGLLAMVDSKPTTLGTTVEYDVRVSDSVEMGAGLTVLWPFDNAERLLKPLVETFAQAVVGGDLFPHVRGEAAISFPILTLAEMGSGWQLIPLAQLPSLAISAEADIGTYATLASRLTLQPVITNTTLLTEPIGRISDNCLILPMGSAFIRYLP
jgi:hypothetical protein